jgi:hypothetical protein
MKRISMLAFAGMAAAASLILGTVSASASSNPTTEVAKSGQYESIVNCPQWGGAKEHLSPIINLPYSPATVTGTKGSSTTTAAHPAADEPYDPLVTCTVTFLQQARPPAMRDALFHVDPGLTAGPAGNAIEHACSHSARRVMVRASASCCAWNSSGKGQHRTVMYTCCGQTKSPTGHVSYVCCTTPHSGQLHGRMLYACCADLHGVAAFMPSCVVLDTGFGGMAAQVSRHEPYSVRRRS